MFTVEDDNNGRGQEEDMMKLGVTPRQAAGCAMDAAVGSMQMSSPGCNSGTIKRRKNQAGKVVCIPAPTTLGLVSIPSDLWAWRKYGQKPIKGSPHPRGYYKCCTKGCPARKEVERSQTDPNMLVITYTSEHKHPSPTQRNALAGSTQDHQTATSTSTTTSTVTTTSSTSPMILKEQTLTLCGSSDQALARDQRSMNTAAGDHSDHRPIKPESGHHEDFFYDLGDLEFDP